MLDPYGSHRHAIFNGVMYDYDEQTHQYTLHVYVPKPVVVIPARHEDDEDPPIVQPPTPAPRFSPPPVPRPPVTPTQIKTYYLPDPTPAASTNIDIINEIADAMQVPPSSPTQTYADRCYNAASFLKVELKSIPAPTTPPGPLFSDVKKNASNPLLSYIAPVLWIDDANVRAKAAGACSCVLAFIDRVEKFASRASSVGYMPPDNPFSVIARLNALRGNTFSYINLDAVSADDLVFSIKAYVNLLEAENQGGIDFKNAVINTSQFSHIKLSYDGLGGSGNPAADILRFLPDADAIKQENAKQALSVIDFSKRVPHLLFTMEYSPEHEGEPQGTLVGWKKINDASGYILSRRDVFAGRKITWTMDNEQVKERSNLYLQYAKTYALSFLNNIDDASVVVFLDPLQLPNEYYIYKVQAYQTRSEQKGAIFSVATSTVLLTPTARQSIMSSISQADPTGAYAISPWPALSYQLYGSTDFDWILAAANIRASISRQDQRTTTRSYSYVNATSDFLFSQSDSSKLVKPNDPDILVKNINDSIQKFGVNQTIQNLLDETGISFYYEGRDAAEDTNFDRAGSQSVLTSRLFEVIGSAIDPATATINVVTLASNMMQMLSNQVITPAGSLQPGVQGSITSTSGDVVALSPEEATNSQAEGPLQFVASLSSIKDPILDLTTFDGLSKLLRVIRVMSDFSPVKTTISPVVTPIIDLPILPVPELLPVNLGSARGHQEVILPIVPIAQSVIRTQNQDVRNRLPKLAGMYSTDIKKAQSRGFNTVEEWLASLEE